MNIPWDQIIQIVIKLIEGCDDPTPSGIRRPRGLAKLRLEREVRQSMGLLPREWRESGQSIMAEVYAEADKATDDDMQELIELATNRS
jgi:hypothetical protein